MDNTKSVSILCNDSFLSLLKQFSTSKKFWVAFSGGMDSSVLLNLFYTNKNNINTDIEVIYVNHGLQREADDWETFCQNQCEHYGFAFTRLQIIEVCPKGESVEAWARKKRYQLINQIMNDNDVLFTGHHKDDQVETFFLQALRGSGPRGLAAMPLIKNKNNRFHARPLLNYSRSDIESYAKQQKLIWQKDKSNDDNCYNRNYFRHQLAPIIENRWPSYRNTINRLIEHQKESKKLLDEIAREDILRTQHGNKASLDIDIIKSLNIARQKNLIFFWLEQLDLQLPGSKNIERIIADVIHSSVEKSPCVNWADVEIRRYKHSLYAIEKTAQNEFYNELNWQPENKLNLHEETLVAKSNRGIGVSKEKVKETGFTIRFRKGGEKINPDGLVHSKTVKQIFQERSVLPWLRDKVPLVFIDNKLAVIPGFCVDKKFVAKKDEPSWDIQWSGYNNCIQS